MAPYAAVSMESTPIVDYAVPQMMPGILADQVGYQAKSKKEASVKGRELPGEYRLVNTETKEIVYSGAIDKITYNEELDLYTGYIDFTEYAAEGSYYLECDLIGRSFPFVIEKELYQNLFEEACESYLNNCREQTASITEVTELLTAYEWYPEIFSDADGDQIPDVLTELKQWTILLENQEIDTTEGANYAAFLAKFSYMFQKYDVAYATECLQRSSTIFDQVQNTLQKDAESFFALTELYRATGLSTYRNQIADYKTYFENNSSYLEEPGYLQGTMTYLVTRQKVDLALCTTFMGKVMDRGEEVSKRYQDMIHPVTAKNNGVEDLLKRATELSCANYVLNNYQYTSILEEILHYLMGKNQESVCFYRQEAAGERYLLLLAQLAAIDG